MKLIHIALVVAAGMVSPVFAQSESDPNCSEFLAMDQTMQMSTVESMSTEGMTTQGTTESTPDEIVSRATDACVQYPDSTVSEALKMMEQN
jgi:hypothetical protein